MARKGPKKHLKRLAVPRHWKISRHQHYWAARPRCGPHTINQSIPLLNLVRGTLATNYSARETIRVLHEGKVLVDGVVRRDHKFPVGLMDVVSIPAINKLFRILPVRSGGLDLHPIEKSEAGFKLCSITNKTIVKGGNLQLNLHDGRNILVQKAEATGELSTMGTHDTLKIELPSQKIIDAVKFEIGTLVLISDGKNIGLSGRVEEIHNPRGTSLVTNVALKTSRGTVVEVPLKYTFAIGKEEPLISYQKLEDEQSKS